MKLLKGLSFVFCLVAMVLSFSGHANAENSRRRPVPVPSDFPNQDNQVYGAWVSNQPIAQQDGLTVWFLIYFNQKTIAASAQCSFPDRDLVATARVPVQITPSSIAVLQPGQDVQNGPNNENCNVNIQAATMNYQVSGDSLQLVDPSTNAPLMFTRIR